MPKRLSTSLHQLSGDQGLNPAGKAVWLVLNAVRNRWFPNRYAGLRVVDFAPELTDDDWLDVQAGSSPSRTMSDLLWLKLDWAAIRAELGELHVLDTGAGRGEYALRLNASSGGLTSYLGVDHRSRSEWDDVRRELDCARFVERDCDAVLEVIPPQTNLFVSQSAIEHFQHDLHYFDQLRQFIEQAGHSTIQIHLFPSAACLGLYLVHGVRQYTPRSVSTIAALFEAPGTSSTLVRLGGRSCNQLHFRFITRRKLRRGGDWRETKRAEYEQLLRQAVEADIASGVRDPSFYALVIHSNFRQPIFESMRGLKAPVE